MKNGGSVTRGVRITYNKWCKSLLVSRLFSGAGLGDLRFCQQQTNTSDEVDKASQGICWRLIISSPLHHSLPSRAASIA